jgi:hypothetical protein
MAALSCGGPRKEDATKPEPVPQQPAPAPAAEPLPSLPTHALPGEPGRAALREAADLEFAVMSACDTQGIPWTADVEVRGIAGAYRVDRRVKVAFNLPSVRIESVPLVSEDAFVLTASHGPTTLLLDRGKLRITPQRTADVLERIAGMPLGPLELEGLLRGCYLMEGGAVPTTYNREWMAIPGGRNGRSFFRRESPRDPWRMMTLFYPGAGLQPGWRIDYFEYHDGIPRLITVTGLEVNPVRLEIRLSNVTPASLPQDLFEQPAAANARPIALDQIDIQRVLRHDSRSALTARLSPQS